MRHSEMKSHSASSRRTGVWPGQVYVGPFGVEYQILGRYENHIWALILGHANGWGPREPKSPETYTVAFFEQKGMHLKYDLEAE